MCQLDSHQGTHAPGKEQGVPPRGVALPRDGLREARGSHLFPGGPNLIQRLTGEEETEVGINF